MKGKVLLRNNSTHYGGYYIPDNTDKQYYVYTGSNDYYTVTFPEYTNKGGLDIYYWIKYVTTVSGSGKDAGLLGVGGLDPLSLYYKENQSSFRYYVNNSYNSVIYNLSTSAITTIRFVTDTNKTILTINGSSFTNNNLPVNLTGEEFYLGSVGLWKQYMRSQIYGLTIKTAKVDYNYSPAVSRNGEYGLFCKENKIFYSGSGTGMTGNFTYK